MFTGIVEQLGTVASIVETATGRRLVVEGEGLGDLPLGASIAVNGVCLTACRLTGALWRWMSSRRPSAEPTSVASSPATASIWSGRCPPPGVSTVTSSQGHVDGVGVVVSLESETDGAVVMEISVSPELTRYLVEKGSITVDGVSLTVAALTDDGFTVALIPHTLEVTTLGLRAPRDTVNLEMDVLAKYVERLMTFNS